MTQCGGSSLFQLQVLLARCPRGADLGVPRLFSLISTPRRLPLLRNMGDWMSSRWAAPGRRTVHLERYEDGGLFTCNN